MQLENLTIIIPIYIDSEDRLNNAKTVLGYLNKWFKTNVIIHELIDKQTNLNFLDSFKNLNINHIIEHRNGQNYHRTRQLNEMLSLVKTDIVLNYDIDVILPVNSYIESYHKIESDFVDVVYPYGNGKFQKRIYQNFDRIKFNIEYDISLIDNNFDIWDAAVGHCFFIKTQKYKYIGGENEKFIAYGPEDVERYERFNKFELKIDRISDFVYHFEHYRREFSSYLNPDFHRNEDILREIRNMDIKYLKEYYSNIDYRLKYNF